MLTESKRDTGSKYVNDNCDEREVTRKQEGDVGGKNREG